MSSTRRLFLGVLLAGLGLASDAAAGPRPAEVAVSGSRVHVGDIAPDAGADEAAVDLGPTPAVGGSRLLTRDEVLAALAAKSLPAPHNLPGTVRLVRKVKRLMPVELDALVRQSAADQSLGRGVVLAGVHAQRSLDVPEGWSHLVVEVPRAPKKAGGFSTSATTSFLGPDDEVLVRAMVPIDLVVSAEGATYDAPRGAAVTLVVRRNLIEVRASGVTEGDADVGDPVSVQLTVSGRIIHARLLSKDEAIAIEAAR